MNPVTEVFERVRALLLRGREEAELDEELRHHVDMEAEHLVRVEGLTPKEARPRSRWGSAWPRRCSHW